MYCKLDDYILSCQQLSLGEIMFVALTAVGTIYTLNRSLKKR